MTIYVPSNMFMSPVLVTLANSTLAGKDEDCSIATNRLGKDSNKEHGDCGTTYRIQNVDKSVLDNNFQLTMDLPGVKREDVTLTLSNGVLKVEALRKTAGKVTQKYGRSFALDPKSLILQEMSSTLSDGVLLITIPTKPTPETIHVTPVASDPPTVTHDDAGKENPPLHLTFELPGVKLNDLKVSVEKGETLVIEAERKGGRSPTITKRSFTLDAETVDIGQISAFLMDGILTITAPKMTANNNDVNDLVIPVGKDGANETPQNQSPQVPKEERAAE